MVSSPRLTLVEKRFELGPEGWMKFDMGHLIKTKWDKEYFVYFIIEIVLTIYL